MLRYAFALCLVALALPLQQHLVGAAHDATKHQSAERRDAGDCLKHTPDNNPYNLTHPCSLTNALYKYATCKCVQKQDGSPAFSDSDVQVILDFIASLEDTLVSCGCDTNDVNDTVVLEVALQIQVFFSAHVSIANALDYLSFTDSFGNAWGNFRDFTDSVVVEISFGNCGPALQFEPSSGGCPTTDAITASAQASSDAQIIAECQQVTVEFNAIVASGQYNVTEELSFLFQIISAHCSAKTIAYLQANCIIGGGFGSFAFMFQLAKVNHQVQNMNSYMSGSDSHSCPFLADLAAEIASTCSNTSGTNYSECNTLVNFQGVIQSIWASSVSIEVRVQGCVESIYQNGNLAPWFLGVPLPSCGCTLYDILILGGFCSNFGCCDYNAPPPSLPGAASSAAPTTPAATTPAATTHAAATTPAPLNDCTKCDEFASIDVNCQVSAFVLSVQAVMAHWDFNENRTLAPTLTNCKNEINSSDDVTTKKKKMAGYIDAYQAPTGGNATLRADFINIKLYFLTVSCTLDLNNEWGTVGGFAACGDALNG